MERVDERKGVFTLVKIFAKTFLFGILCCQCQQHFKSAWWEFFLLRLLTWDSDSRRVFGNIDQGGLTGRTDLCPHFYSIEPWGVWQAIERGHRFLHVFSIPVARRKWSPKVTHSDLPSLGILWPRGSEDCKSSTDRSSGPHKENLTHLMWHVNSIAILRNWKYILTDEDAQTHWIVKFANVLQCFEDDIVWRIDCLCDPEYSMCRWLCSSKRRAVFDVIEPVQLSLAMGIQIAILGGITSKRRYGGGWRLIWWFPMALMEPSPKSWTHRWLVLEPLWRVTSSDTHREPAQPNRCTC